MIRSLAAAAVAASTFAFAGSAGQREAVRIETLHYASTIDPLPDLRARVAFPDSGARRLPILVLMHGFRLDAASFTDETYRRLASSGGGLFVAGVDLRGRGGSSGRPDGGGREIHDILDAVDAIARRYADRVNPTSVHLFGYSGGGANVLSAAGRFPDRFASVAAFFPIADYGYDRALGWHRQASAEQRRDLDAWIGAPGSTAYASRAPLFAIANYRDRPLRIFHDREDTNVRVAHTEAIVAQARRAGLANLEPFISGPTDAVRWRHEGPNGDAPVIRAEARLLPDVLRADARAAELSRRGRLAIAGYLVTHNFSVWLGRGTDARGWVDYDLDAGRFDISYDAGDAPWQLTVTGRTPGAPVTLTINGRRVTRTATGAGIVSIDSGPSAAPADSPRQGA